MSIIWPGGIVTKAYGVTTGNSHPSITASRSIARLPSDPIFRADVSVKNMVIGSRWMLGYDAGGTFTELDSGTAAAEAFTISSVPSYASPFLLELRVRKASGAPKYKPVKVYAYHTPAGVTMYVSQFEDEVA